MSISSFISGAIILNKLEQYDAAFALVCSTVDATSKKIYPSDNNNHRNKNFIKKYFRIISTFGFPGIRADGMKIRCRNIPDIKTDKEEFVAIEDIIYHIIRCGLVHECKLDNRLQFINETRIGDFDGYFQLPKQIIWGLIIAVILCENNQSEKCNKNIEINIKGQVVKIDEMWGQEKKWLEKSLND
ncbi:MAG: hypothetical protein IT280_10030 [Ignavibacteria bacterium]|nr:hypothetical protein [Ignavibacteria bacterium]